MKIGINHQILTTDPMYADWWNAVKSWAQIIRVDTHMGAYAWAVHPNHVYSNGISATAPFEQIAKQCRESKIAIDFIRDGFPSSENWRKLGGDWSSFDSGNWREFQLPKEAWSACNKWITEMGKVLMTAKTPFRWQGPNEQFNRGHDQQAYLRLKNIYAQSSYGKQWTSPTIWGDVVALPKLTNDWNVLQRFDQSLSKSTILSFNAYPNRGHDQVYVVAVADTGGGLFNQAVVISEFGYSKQQIPDEAQRVAQLANDISEISQYTTRTDSIMLYWDQADYYISPAGLFELGQQLKTKGIIQQ